MSEKVTLCIKEDGPPYPEAWPSTVLDVSMTVNLMGLVKQGLFFFQ